MIKNLNERIKRYSPVSYTHLDVYKRQLQAGADGPEGLGNFAEVKFCKEVFDDLIVVWIGFEADCPETVCA